MQLPPNETTLVLILRSLLISEIVLSMIAIPLILWSGSITDSMLAEAGIQPPEVSQAELVVLAFTLMLFVISNVCLLLCWIGLFNFWGWSRWVYLGNALLYRAMGIPISFFDFSFSWGLPETILEVAGPIEGAVIAIIFLTPIARRFEPEPTVLIVG